MKSPATLDEFYRTFPTEQRCWEALRRLRWPDGFRCPRCAGRRAHRLRERGLWQCASCRYQASLTAGTPFHGTRVALRSWFLAMFFVGRHKQGISSLQFQRDPGLGSYKTAWALLHKVRSALAHNPLFRLEGDVEVDETYIGGHRPGRLGRGVGRRHLVRGERLRAAVGPGQVTRAREPHGGWIEVGRATRCGVVPFVRSYALEPRLHSPFQSSGSCQA